MATTIPISVRVSDEDAEFIARLNIPGAATPSDKLRAIIAEARARQDGLHDFGACLNLVQELLAPARNSVRAAEFRDRVHSELVAAVADWLPEAVATVVSHRVSPPSPASKAEGDAAARGRGSGTSADSVQALVELERALADRVFLLIERILRMGVTSTARCYDPRAIADRIGPVLEIAQLIEQSQRRPA